MAATSAEGWFWVLKAGSVSFRDGAEMAATWEGRPELNTLSAALKTSLYVSAVKSSLLMCSRTLIGNLSVHKARTAAAQSHPIPVL